MLKSDLVAFFREFYAKASLPKAFSSSFVTLISKNDNPQGLGEYRTIELSVSVS